MPTIEVQPRDAKRLEKVSPRHLKGPRMLTRQIVWAIDEAFDRAAGASNGKRKKAS